MKLTIGMAGFAAGAMLLFQPVDSEAGLRKAADRWAPAVARIACRSVGRYRDCGLTGVERDSFVDGEIRRTQYHLSMGPGKFDTLTIHRVRSRHNEDRRDALLLLPGTGLDVENVYLPGLNVTDDEAYSPLILAARQGIDAWSADYRGSDLPADLTDFAFMAGWGLETTVEDMQLALRFVRLMRLFSGDGYRKVFVGGYSAGVSIAVSVASADASRHYARQDVRGLIAVDDTFDIDPASGEQACVDLEIADAMLADGVFADPGTSFVVMFSQLAKTDPDGESPFFPGATNLDFFNFATVLPPPGSPGPFHIFGGQFDENGVPFPVFTEQQFAINQGTVFEPVLPVRLGRDVAAVRCSATPVFDLDAGLSDIVVPVLHIGAAGGNGNAIDYTLGRLGSTDITSTVIFAEPPVPPVFDYGHGDMFSATDAADRVWQPIVDWIRSQ